MVQVIYAGQQSSLPVIDVLVADIRAALGVPSRFVAKLNGKLLSHFDEMNTLAGLDDVLEFVAAATR